MRSALSAFIVALPALILTRQWVEAVTGAGVGWFGAAETLLVVSAGAWSRARVHRASAVAHRLVDVLEECDSELRVVSMAGDTGATDRISEQIASLEPNMRAGNEMSELLRLLRAQLES